MPIHLQAITRENFEAIAALEVHKSQWNYLASNAYSIAEASFDPSLHTRAIYCDARPVGFLMTHHPVGEAGAGHTVEIWRFMVDASEQGKGHGRAALRLVLDELRADPSVRRVGISYTPDNQVAQALYAGLGFVETAIDEATGEMEAVLELAAEGVERPALG